MSEKMKRYLGLAGVILLLSASYAAVKFVNSYSASVQPSSFRSFAVSADGKATSIPDIAKFSFSIITEGGKNIKDLTDKNNSKANDIIKFLEGSKVDKADIKTTAYSVLPRTQYYNCDSSMNIPVKPCPPSDIIGYTITQSAEVKVRDFSIIGDVLNGVVVKGANNVSDLQFTTDDPTQAEDLARADALKKAMKKAADLAAAGGFGLGRLLSIDESSYSPMPYYPNYAGGVRALSADSAPVAPIQPGSQETKVSLTLRYEIK